MKKFLFFSVFVLLFGFIKSQNVLSHVDADTFQKLLDTKNYVLIDLRTADEINSKGLIDGAIQIDYLGKDSEKKIELEKQKEKEESKLLNTLKVLRSQVS